MCWRLHGDLNTGECILDTLPSACNCHWAEGLWILCPKHYYIECKPIVARGSFRNIPLIQAIAEEIPIVPRQSQDSQRPGHTPRSKSP